MLQLTFPVVVDDVVRVEVYPGMPILIEAMISIDRIPQGTVALFERYDGLVLGNSVQHIHREQIQELFRKLQTLAGDGDHWIVDPAPQERVQTRGHDQVINPTVLNEEANSDGPVSD